MTAVKTVARTRTLEIRCRWCGCSEACDVPVHAVLDGRPWALRQGEGALLRQGGCDQSCECHDLTRDANRPMFRFHLSTPRVSA